MTETRLLVLHCPAGGGHKAAALAVAEAAAARGAEATVLDALELTPRWFASAYVGAHLRSTEHTPAMYGLGYAAMNQRNALSDGVRGLFDRAMGQRLLEHVQRVRPTAVIATHFFPLEILGHARRTGALDVPVIGVVTDYAAHAFWAEPGVDVFCVAPGRAAEDVARFRSSARVVATGIPVRPSFAAIAPLVAPRTNEPLRVLVTSGGFGVGPMLEVLRSFAGAVGIELTVVCGANEARVADAKRVVTREGLDARVVGFERDMPARLAEAHVVVGKPGGLTVSEALVAGRPMVLVGACPGQELENQRWLVAEKAAIAAPPEGAAAAVSRFRAAATLERFARVARSLGRPRAADAVVDVALAASTHVRAA